MEEKALFQTTDGSIVTRSDILRALEAVKAADASILFVHSEISFGIPNPSLSRKDLLGVLIETLGELRVPTLVMPTFTFSFCNGEAYDVDNSRSQMGALNEYFRRLPEAVRSIDPLMSVSAVGAQAGYITEVGRHSVGQGSSFDKLHQTKGARFLFFGVAAAKCFTYTHYVEEREAVPYRYDRPFTGMITTDGKTYEDTYLLFVRYNGVKPNYTTKFEDYLIDAGLLKRVSCGNNFVASLTESDGYSAIAQKLHEDIDYFLSEPYPRDTKDTSFVARNMVAL